MKIRFSIMKRSYLRVGLGAAMFIAAFALFFGNARLSEEFTGWVKIVVNKVLDGSKVEADIKDYFKQQWFQSSTVSVEINGQTTKLALKTEIKEDEKVNIFSKDIQKLLVSKKYISDPSMIIEQSITWPSVGNYMQKSARTAIIVWVILMAIYMTFSFAGIRGAVSPSVLAVVTIITMLFDVVLPAGLYGVWMAMDKTVMIDSVFIIALLTNMWYSINDTIIIFDRIRENIKKRGSNKWVIFGKIFEDSLWQTMRRSLGTVSTVLIVVVAMFIFGDGIIKQFAFTIGMGVIFGSYSSIFMSAPMAYIILGFYKKERKQMLALETKDL